jgi:hypothetical protein
MATLQTGNFGDLMVKGFRTVYFGEWDALEKQYPKIVTIEKADQLNPKSTRISTFATASQKAQASGATEHTFAQMYDVSYTLYSYSNYYKVSRELKDNDLYDVVAKAPKILANAHRDAMEVVAANVYNNAFDVTYPGGDGLELCSAVHPLVSGTASNYVNADLNKTTLEAAIAAMRSGVDDQGKLIKMIPKKLIVPPELEATAYELINSKLDPESANNAVNFLNSRGIEIVVADYLTDAKSWFLKGQQDSIKMFIGKGTEERPELLIQATTDTTLDTLVQTYNRFGTGWDDYRGIYGAEGV